jgi:hypothetical protein
MATKKPLVMGSDGRPQQLQSGDTLAGATETGQVNQTAAATLIAGQAVYTAGNDSVNKAKADASGTKDVLGLATAAITSSSSGTIQCNGVLALTTAQWDALCGTSGGLTAGTSYFLSPATAGLLTATVPTTAGQYVAEVGRALSTTELLIDIRPPILL